MAVFRVGPLPDDALGGAAAFHTEAMPAIREALRLESSREPADGTQAPADRHLALLFGPAPPDHHDWRLAAVRDLARAAAPVRVNGLAGGGEAAIACALAYLAGAPGVTGQLLVVDDESSKTD